ncbi:LOW QUALITY PROTEIN: hypothetical protein V1477_003068 [Vespula maculifrons]|uniref:Uncharacterized protein n=1 Tax=Vespula maculifrons TaxID=7453 RepID=A0ABD2CTI6_VESMC
MLYHAYFRNSIQFFFIWTLVILWSLALYLHEWTLKYSQEAIRASIKEELIEIYNNLHCEVGILGFARRQQSRTFERLSQFSLALNFDEYTSQFSQYAFSVSNNEELMQNEMVERGYSPTRGDNKIGPLIDFYSYASDFDERT